MPKKNSGSSPWTILFWLIAVIVAMGCIHRNLVFFTNLVN